MTFLGVLSHLLFWGYWALGVMLCFRVVLRRRPVGVSLAWLAVILLVPYAGSVLYLMVGETWIGSRRSRRLKWFASHYEKSLAASDFRQQLPNWQALPQVCEALDRQAIARTGVPALSGNALEIIDRADPFFKRLVDDIDGATQSCYLEYYICDAGGSTSMVFNALKRASARGVICKLIVDDVGSRPFLRSAAARELKKAGVAVRASFPVRVMRGVFSRIDIRNHPGIVELSIKTQPL